MTENESRRRGFLKTAATGILILKPATAFGYQANSNVEVGLIGCGGRGNWIAPFFPEHTGARVVALADVVKDHLDSTAATFRLSALLHVRSFRGLRILLQPARGRNRVLPREPGDRRAHPHRPIHSCWHAVFPGFSRTPERWTTVMITVNPRSSQIGRAHRLRPGGMKRWARASGR